jgi:hypothetical protein
VLGALAALGVGLALVPTGQTSRVELNAEAFFEAWSTQANGDGEIDGVPLSGTGQLLGGGGAAGVTVFLPRLKDDDGPPGAQPFLQRLTRLHLGGGGDRLIIDYPVVAGGFGLVPAQIRRSISRGWFNAWADGYVHGSLYLGASLSFEGDTWSDQPLPLDPSGHELILTPQVEIGLRWYDVRLSAGWGVTATKLDDNDFHVRFWGSAFASVYSVVRRWVELGAGLRVIEDGVEVNGSAAFWLQRRLAFHLAVGGGHGRYVDSGRPFDYAGGALGLECWINRHASLTLSYAPRWQNTSDTDYSTVQHVLTLTLIARD